MPSLKTFSTRSSPTCICGMAKLRVSAKARRDLERIGDDGAVNYGLAASDRHIEGFRRLFALLRDQPFAGRQRGDLSRGMRSLSHRPHVILYRVDGDTVVIDRIIHQARDVTRALRGQH
jgi:toxin ParE1/3/4